MDLVLRQCRYCGKLLPISEFTGKKTICKYCVRDYDWQRRYGISPEQYFEIYKAQDGVCAICGKKLPEGEYLRVDHNKCTGDVRRLLCNECNLGLGKFKDSIQLIINAYEYLHKGNV